MKAKVIGAMAAVLLAGWMVGTARADFTLTGSQELTVDTYQWQGWLFQQSKVTVLYRMNILNAFDSSSVTVNGLVGDTRHAESVNYLYAAGSSTIDIIGGSVGYLNARDSSAVNLSGGSVGYIAAEDVHYSLDATDSSTVNFFSGGSASDVNAYKTSTVNFSGGSAGYLNARNSSTVNFSVGSVSYLNAYDSSSVDITGGYVSYLDAYGSSTVNISGERVSQQFIAHDSSTVNMSGGLVSRLYATGSGTVNFSGGSAGNISANTTSTVNISGGSVRYLAANGTSAVNISGGSVGHLAGDGAYGLYSCDSSTISLHGQDFIIVTGLSLDGDKVLGTGILSGKWLDGTPWTVNIMQNDPGATILAIPEPATLSLLALLALSLPKRGGLALLRSPRRPTAGRL